MLDFIFKSFTGSFSRTLGRWFAYLCLGLLIYLLINHLDINLLDLLQ